MKVLKTTTGLGRAALGKIPNIAVNKYHMHKNRITDIIETHK
jgi:hypothetical protein